MTPEWLQRFVPAGTSRGKLLLAGGMVVAALGVLAWDVIWVMNGDEDENDGTAAALELPLAGSEDSSQSAMTPPEMPLVPVTQHAPRDVAVEAAPGGTTATLPPGEVAAPGAAGALDTLPDTEPDWAALFAQLIAREAAAQDAGGAGLASVAPDSALQAVLEGHSLRGVVQTEDGGVALINGRLLRAGDALPGTELTVVTILNDRVLLRTPDRSALVPLLLQPMRSRTSGGAP